MVAVKRRHLGAYLAAVALILSFLGFTQFVGAQVPAYADAPGLVWFCGPGVLRVVGCY